MNLRIRRLGRNDAVLAEQVIRAFKGASRPLGSLVEFLGNSSNYLLIAERDSEACGYVMPYRLERPDREASQMFVYEISVAASWQGRGIATALIGEITALARANGMFEAFVLTSKGNDRARRLYVGTGGVIEDDSAMLFVYPLGSRNVA